MLYITIPTAGSHIELLENLVDDCGLPRNQIVIVQTRPEIDLPHDVITLEDFGAPNIQRWWNRGISECVQRGASKVAVLNDDIVLNAQSLPLLVDAMNKTGATIASPSRPPTADGLYKKPLVPYLPRLWGCFWVLDTSTSLRPDEEFVWWYGDSDLDIRARRHFGGVVNVDVFYEHHFPGIGTIANKSLQEQTNIDAIVFQQRYARILTLTRIFNRLHTALQRLNRFKSRATVG